MTRSPTFPQEGRSRVAIGGVSPQINAGRYPVKRSIGERLVVEADVFADGNVALGAAVKYRDEKSAAWLESPMQPLGKDRWRGEFPVSEPGVCLYAVEAWIDRFQSWRDTKEALTEYLNELTHSSVVEFFRPNLWTKCTIC